MRIMPDDLKGRILQLEKQVERNSCNEVDIGGNFAQMR